MTKHVYTIEASNIDDLREQVAELNAALNGASAPTVSKAIPDLSHTVVAGAAKEAPKSTTAPRGRGRPPLAKKEEPAPVAQEPEVVAAADETDPFGEEPTVQEETVTLTLDDVKLVAQKVVEVKGMPELKKLVQAFKASKLADLKDDQYGPFIQSCEKLLPATK